MKKNSGQALTEYLMLMLVVASAFTVLLRYLPSFFENMEGPLKKDFKYTYQYGNKDARGFGDEDGGGPKNHPRYYLPGSFRLFARGKSP